MSRFLNEFQIRCTQHQVVAFRGNPDHLVIFLLVWRIVLRAGGVEHISINAIASSLKRPYESVRRHVHQLVRDNWLTLDDKGVTLAKSTRVAEALADMEPVMLARLQYMLDSFAAFNVQLPAPLLVRPLAGSATIAAVIDLQLISIEHNNSQMPNVMMLNIMGAMLVLNIEEFAHDPKLSPLYAKPDQVPPVSVRKPVSLNSIASMLSASYTSVWRHAQVMLQNGVIEQIDERYIVSPAWLGSRETDEAAQAIFRHMRRALLALAATLKA